MRVLTFTTLFPNRQQPTRGVFVRERTARVARLCDVTVVAPVPFPGGGAPRKEEIAGLDVYHPRYWSLPGRWPGFKPRTIARAGHAVVARLHRKQPFDIIDAHFAHPDGVAAALIAERLSIPLVLSVRGSDVHRDLKDPALRHRVLGVVDRADAVMAVASPLAEALREAGADGDKIDVIPNGIDQGLFSLRDRDQARREVGADDSDAPLLLAVGSLVPVKGFDVLLDALAAAKTRARLWIVGAGPARAALRARAERLGLGGRVRFLGTLRHEWLPAYYAAADLFVLASRNEGCPNVLLEALSSGCPVVATRVGHAPALVTNGDNGTLVEPGNATDMAHAIDGTLLLDHDRAQIRATIERHTWERTAERVRDVFTRALGRAARERRSASCSA